MIKVLMIGNDSSVKGGITSVISQLLAHNWTQEDIQMEFIPTYIETNNFKKILYFGKQYLKIKKEIKNNRPDVVHIHMSYRGSFTRKYVIHQLCKKNHIPDIIHLHGSEFKKWYDEVDDQKKAKIRTLLKESGAFIVLGEKWNKTIKEIEPATNTVVVSNTVHIPEQTVAWAEPFKVLFLGVLIKRKGVSDLLKATELLKKKHGNTQFQIVVAGSGAEEENLKSEAKSLNVEDVVQFAGWTAGQKKIDLLNECQMLVLPSYNEGLPIAILEAISYGMPVVSTDVGDISSAVREGENGYLVTPGDYTSLASRIEEIVFNKDLYEELSANAKRIAEEDFSDTQYFKIISDCYKKIGG